MPSLRSALHVKDERDVIFFEERSTFHRGYDFALAVMPDEIAVYCRKKSILPRWHYIPVNEIKVIEFSSVKSPADKISWPIVVSFSLLLFVSAYVWNMWQYYVLLSVLLVSAYYYKSEKEFPRSIISIKSEGSIFVFVSPQENYADEKMYDHELIARFAEALKTKGIPVIQDAR